MKYKLKDKVSQKQTINKKKVQYGGSTYVEKPVKKGKILSDKEIEKLTPLDKVNYFRQQEYPETNINYHTKENAKYLYPNGTTRAYVEGDEIFINKENPGEILNELTHLEQRKNNSSINTELRRAKDLVNNNFDFEKSYDDPNSFEYEAHELIQPEIRKKYNNFLRDFDDSQFERDHLNRRLGTIIPKVRQYGGNGNTVLIEDEELYKDEFGNIKESNSFSHDDKYVISKGVITPVSKGNGGEIVDDATQVLSASYEQVKSGDRESNLMEQKVAFTAKEANKLLQDNGFTWFNTKKKMSPSELVRTANEQTKKHFKLDADQNNDYSKNSVDANLAQIPDVDVFDLVFEKQQQSKDQGVKKQYGGEIEVTPNGMYEVGENPVIVPTDNTGRITTQNLNTNIDAYNADNGEFLETLYPDNEYELDANNILEIPSAQYGYNEWRNKLPKNLQDTTDYNLRGAYESKLSPELVNGEYHLPSRNPITGEILKSELHPTFNLALEEDEKLGYKAYKKDNKVYTFDKIPDKTFIPYKKQLGGDIIKDFPQDHIVRQGEFLSKIASDYGLDVKTLIEYNPELKDINKISIGQKIKIPEIKIKGNKTLPVDRSAEIEGITELPEEKTDVVLDEEIPILDVKAETVDKKQDVANKIADVVKGVNIGKIDKSVPTNALREMMRANRSIALPYRTEVPNRTFGYTEEDPSLYLDELDSQVTQAMQQINPNTSQGLAIQSELLNNVAKNKRNIINQVNSRNLQRRQQTDNQNVQMQNQFDMMQEQANSQYVDGVQQTIANYDRNRVQQADLLDQMEIGKTRLNNSLVLENMKYPNYQIDENGNVIRIGTDFKVPLNTTTLETKKARYGLKVKK